MFGNDCYREYIFNSTLEWPIQQILVGMQFNIKQMLSADIWHIVIKNSEFTQVLQGFHWKGTSSTFPNATITGDT